MIPPIPDAEHSDVGTAETRPRYEDITQDGRVMLTALMSGLGMSVWRAMSKRIKADAFAREGMMPLLRRLILVGEGAPFSVGEKITYEGTWRFAREQDGERIFLLMWMEARAQNGPTYGPRPDPSAPFVRVGRVFAEHVVTKPFAPPKERKVTRLPDGIGIPRLPDLEHVFEPAEKLVETAKLEDAGELRFGMMHTDSNQHVNSMVYPRKVEEALVARVGDGKLLARSAEMRWRKPFFAGDRALLKIADRGENSYVATLAPPGTEKISAAIAMTLA